VTGEIICSGTELLLGQTVNANAATLARELAAAGVDVHRQTVVGDNEPRLRRAFIAAWESNQVILVTGGLGPTDDDVTRQAVAGALGLSLVEDTAAGRRLASWYAGRGLSLTPGAARQALVPKGGRTLPNPLGTAPGVVIEDHGRLAVLLPGPPAELEAMLPGLRGELRLFLGRRATGVIASRVLKVTGRTESELQEVLADLLAGANPSLAPCVQVGEIHLRVTAKAQTDAAAREAITLVEREVRRRLGLSVFGVDDQTLPGVVAALLQRHGFSVATAESCTAGLLGYLLTEIPGSSSFFRLGVTAYANEAKTGLLGVPPALLERHGAVSAETAAAMAEGVRGRGGCDIGVSITGIAGPGGGSTAKPVGTVYIGFSAARGTSSRRHRFSGGREGIRRRAAMAALAMLRGHLLKECPQWKRK